MSRPAVLNAAFAAALFLGAGAPLQGQDPAPLAKEEPTGDFAFQRDRAARMTVPVSIDGRGPYQFVVDTGAERTVISQELARELNLAEGRTARLHSMSEVADVDTVVIPRLQVNSRTVTGINAPALARLNLGASGLLGVDSLALQKVLFDFEKQTMTVSPARRTPEPREEPGTIVVRARTMLGRLILADARADGQKIWVVIDTGSQVSIGNEALRRKLAGKKRLGPTFPIELISVTGGKLQGDYTLIKQLHIGGVRVNDMPIAFADAHPFKQLGLTHRPAMLLGMDALGLFDRVSVDFANRRVEFGLPDMSSRNSGVRMASRD
jgi:predicted aspartyl protease